MKLVMLAAWRSLLIAVITLVKTMLNRRSAKGSPGLVPVLVCTMLLEWLVENQVELVTSVKSCSRCLLSLCVEMLCCWVRMLWRSCSVKSFWDRLLLLLLGRKSLIVE